MKSGIVIIGIGLGIGFAACTADLRDNNVCVMYARALCNKASTCGYLTNQSADQCLAPYLSDACKNWDDSVAPPDPRACAEAIDNASCPGDSSTKLADCNRNFSKGVLIAIGNPSSTGGSGGSGGSAASGGTGGTGGSGTTGGTGGSGTTGTGGSGTTGGTGGSGTTGTGGSGTTGGTGGSGTTGGTGGVGGTTGGTGGVPPTATCTSYTPDTTYPCAMTVPANCGQNPVSCGNNLFCVANSTCVPNGCQCNAGYLAVSCATGMRCSGCPASSWGCTLRPDPGCTGNPSQTAGVCTCSNGRTYNLGCGSTVSCDQRCRQGG